MKTSYTFSSLKDLSHILHNLLGSNKGVSWLIRIHDQKFHNLTVHNLSTYIIKLYTNYFAKIVYYK